VERPSWIPEGVDVTVPNAARMYDYALGGSHNFAIDRQTADQIEQMIPGAKMNAYANRAFVDRAVRWLAAQGIRQFLDIGSGIPTMGNVHEIVQSIAPGARVVYVDIDPVAIAHSKVILAGIDHVKVVQADLAQSADVLQHPDVLDLLDFSQPVAVLLNAVLHFIPDDAHPEQILGNVHDAMVRGSLLTLSHGAPLPDSDRADDVENLRNVYRRTPTSLHLRSPERLRELLADWEILEPGVVPVNEWRPDPDDFNPPTLGLLAAIARKR